jgi:hypothetical protein
MKLGEVEIHAEPYITRAYCKCKEALKQVSNGFLGTAFYCSKCDSVYELKLIKVPKKKISKEYLEQCRKEIINVVA